MGNKGMGFMQKQPDKEGSGGEDRREAAMQKRTKRANEQKAKDAKKGKKVKSGPLSKFGKIMEDDEDCVLPTVVGRTMAKGVNLGYNIFMMVNGFSRKLVWFASCIGFMWIFPVTFELFQE